MGFIFNFTLQGIILLNQSIIGFINRWDDTEIWDDTQTWED